ncbi:MAG: class I SAM-dependent methyltransferase [Acidimicrobiales bacterium]
MEADATDLLALFGDDYLHFHRRFLTDEQSDSDADEVAALLGVAPDGRVLDAGCGTGRIANRLAARGLAVTGVDLNRSFVEVAAADARRLGLPVRFVVADLRAVPLCGRFDGAVIWFNSFGYVDDDGNRGVLAELRRLLRPGGCLVIDTIHHDGFVRHFTAAPEVSVMEADDGVLLDGLAFDPQQGRVVIARTVVRGGATRRSTHSLRLPTIPEWRHWLAAAGFTGAVFTGDDGGAADVDSWRLIVRATA